MEWKPYRLDIDIGELPDQLAHDIDAIVDASQEYSLVPHYNAPLKQNLSCFSSDPCDLPIFLPLCDILIMALVQVSSESSIRLGQTARPLVANLILRM